MLLFIAPKKLDMLCYIANWGSKDVGNNICLITGSKRAISCPFSLLFFECKIFLGILGTELDVYWLKDFKGIKKFCI